MVAVEKVLPGPHHLDRLHEREETMSRTNDLVEEARRLVDQLDEEYRDHGDSRRYHDLRDELITWADQSPTHAALVSDVIPV
jgi:hypothetical protein